MIKKLENRAMFLCRGVTLVVLTALIIFLLCALMSYNPSDVSLLYATDNPQVPSNRAGFLGAHCAALLFYLCGGAAFLLVFPLFFVLSVLIKDGRLRDEWERIVSALFLVFVSCALLSVFMIDLSWSPYPGGAIGLSASQWLLYYGDSIGRLLFLYTSFLACVLLCWRFSYMHCVRWVIASLRTCCHAIKHYRLVERSINVVMIIAYSVFIRPVQFLYSFVRSLYDGSAFSTTNLIDYGDQEMATVFDNHVNKVETATDALLEEQSGEPLEQQTENYFSHEYVASTKEVSQETSYVLPSYGHFSSAKNDLNNADANDELEKRASILQDKLKRFGVSGEVVAIKRGPVVTLFEYQPDIDTKLSKIVALEDDLAMALQALSIRILAPIPGKAVVGFEVANTKRNDVLFADVIMTPEYKYFKGHLPLILGKGTVGETVIVDLAKMPHLLIAGSTGSGKSVALNTLLISLLCALSPDELKLILIDPKRLEFAAFADIAHLLFPIVTSPQHAAPVLKWVVQEMEKRYEKMAEKGCRNCADYNASLQNEENALPLIVVVIDELADLMLTAGRDIEELITRITQMARAAGIHMIVATQRPSVDVITGLIKANFPSRISFRVASKIDSRTILDAIGADRLLGRGDMLFLDASTSQLKRVHGAYVSDYEIENIVNHIRSQRSPEYLDLYKEITEQSHSDLYIEDPLFKQVCLFLQEVDEISISLVQRRFRIGYNRSARIIDTLEAQGLIMPQDSGKMRKVIR